MRRSFGISKLTRIVRVYTRRFAVQERMVAPQVAGREGRGRPGLAEGAAFLPETAPWFELQRVKRAQDHLFLRLSTRAGRA